MKIRVEEAVKICEKYGVEEVPLVFLNDIHISGLQITHGMKFDLSQVDLFLSAGVKEIEVIYNERLYAKLVANYPSIYRLPAGRKNVIELDRLIDAMDSSNNASKRKRSLISLTEVYKKNSAGVFEVLLGYGEKFGHKRWNEIKVGLNRNSQIDYRMDEGGIIVFFLLNASDPNYAQKFMKFTDLVTTLVESKRRGWSIAPDLFPETDVYSVNDKTKLLEVYNDTRATLVIIGEDINADYKTALTQLKMFDKFAKMMVIKNIDRTNQADILEKIKTIYGQKLWLE